MKKYIFLAFKNIRRRGLRSWLTMLGIFIGIAAVVSLVSLSGGLKTAIMGQFASMGTDKLTVMNAQTGFGVPGSTAVKKLTQHDIDIIKSVPGVEDVIPRLIRIAQVEYNGISGFYYIGSLSDDPRQVEIIYDTFGVGVIEGVLIGANDRGKVVLGNDFAKETRFDKSISAGTNIMIEGKEFEVSGILEKSSTFQLNMIVLMTEEDMKEILNIGDEQDILVVLVSKGADIENVARQIEEQLRKDRGEKEGEEDFTVQTPLQILEGVNTILNIISIIIAGIAIVSLIVGGVGIANTMYTSVLERFREIGIMKAVGARNFDIFKLFLAEAGLLGGIGGIIGIFIGLGMAYGIAYAANVYFEQNLFVITVSYPLIFGALAFSLVVGIISGVFPAIQASRLKPIEALRA